MTLPEETISDADFKKLTDECADLKINLRLLYSEIHRMTDELLNSKLMNMKLQAQLNVEQSDGK